MMLGHGREGLILGEGGKNVLNVFAEGIVPC